MTKIKKNKKKSALKKNKQNFFVSFPTGSKQRKELKKTIKIIERTIQTAEHFLDIYVTLGVGSTGAPSHQRQDTLRAILVFVSSGLDIFLKQLIKDVLPIIIEKDRDSHESFVRFIEKRLKKDFKRHDEVLPDFKFISNAIGANNSKLFLLNEYEKELTSNSLQSKDEIYRISAAFAITADKINKKINENDLKQVFIDRNNIIHELDINFNKTKASNTRKRKQDEIIKQSKLLLKVMEILLSEINLKLKNDKK